MEKPGRLAGLALPVGRDQARAVEFGSLSRQAWLGEVSRLTEVALHKTCEVRRRAL